jgi:hypothetical protein
MVMILDDTHRCLECEKLLMNQRVFVCDECSKIQHIYNMEVK